MSSPYSEYLIETSQHSTNLLWLDLEMTGIDPLIDRTLHVAAVVGGYDLVEKAIFESLFHYDWDDIEPLIRQNDEFWSRYPELEETYRKQASSGISIDRIDEQLAIFIDQNFDAPAILAGNSIFEDRKWIDRDLPKVRSRLDRRMVDVSSFKLVARGMKALKYPKQTAHDPISDIRESRQELYVLTGAGLLLPSK